MTYLWIVGVLLIVSLLIYFERTAMLYVLATAGVTALLLVVAVSDLGGNESADSTSFEAQAGPEIGSSRPNLSRK